MNETTKAYLAGCLDSDGYFTIKRSTYHLRVRRDATQPVYSEKIGLKQVTEYVPRLLHESFGGYYRIEKPSTKNGKPLHSWTVTDRKAIECVTALLPYLHVKREQAELLVELRRLKGLPRKVIGVHERPSRWGKMVKWPHRIVAPEVVAQKDKLFDKIHSLNCINNPNPTMLV